MKNKLDPESLKPPKPPILGEAVLQKANEAGKRILQASQNVPEAAVSTLRDGSMIDQPQQQESFGSIPAAITVPASPH